MKGKKLSNAFKRLEIGEKNILLQKRNKGFVHDWISSKIYKIHESFGLGFPNDLLYETIHETLCSLVEGYELESDVYTHDLKNFAMESYADEFVEEAMQQGNKSYSDLLMLANLFFKLDVQNKVRKEFGIEDICTGC